MRKKDPPGMGSAIGRPNVFVEWAANVYDLRRSLHVLEAVGGPLSELRESPLEAPITS